MGGVIGHRVFRLDDFWEAGRNEEFHGALLIAVGQFRSQPTPTLFVRITKLLQTCQYSCATEQTTPIDSSRSLIP